MTTFIGISRDHSGSMHSLRKAAIVDYNAVVSALQSAATSENSDVRLSVVSCGGPSSYNEVKTVINNAPINTVPLITEYDVSGGGTPLVDSILKTISLLESQAAIAEPNSRFVVMATTDGGENSSRAYPSALKEKIKTLSATGNWTFVIRAPKGYAKDCTKYGFPIDNILEWETNSSGQAAAQAVTTQALTSFVNSNERSTTKFFANLSNVSVAEVKAQLVDISPQVTWLFVGVKEAGIQIRDFVESKTNKPLLKGSAFYQLVKIEPKVQANKRIAILNKKTGEVYEGAAARQLIGLPTIGTVRLAPDELGEFEVYIQSTSVNRKVDPNTKILIWENVGKAFKEGKSAQ